MATPVLRAMRRHFALSEIVCYGGAAALETLSGTAWADRLVADFSTRRKPRWAGFVRQVLELRRERFDLAVLLPNSFRVAALAKFGKARRIVGYDRDGRGWMLTDKIEPPRDSARRFAPVPTIDYYAALAATLGVPCESRRMELAVTEPDRAAAETMLARISTSRDGPLVMLNPGASFGTSKLWLPERFAAVADALIECRGARVVINAAPGEREVAARVGREMRNRPAINFAERDNSIGLLKGLIRRCSLLITNDTGARHLAAAFGAAVVTVFGSTDPTWARIDYARERIVRAEVPCSPCQRKICPNPPGPQHHQCMYAVSVEMVLAAAEGLLDEDGVASREESR